MKATRTHHTPFTNRPVVTEEEAWASPETIGTALGNVYGAPESKRKAARRSVGNFKQAMDDDGFAAFKADGPEGRTPINTVEEIFGQGTAAENRAQGEARMQRLAPDIAAVAGDVIQIPVQDASSLASHPEVHIVEQAGQKAS